MKTPRHPHSLARRCGTALLVAAAAMAAAGPARAQRDNPSAALSALSTLPLAVSVALPVATVSLAGAYTLKAVEVSGDGVVWVLQRGSDGVRASVRLSAGAAQAASVDVGRAMHITACSVGWLIQAGGKAIAVLPSERGRALLHNERVTL